MGGQQTLPLRGLQTSFVGGLVSPSLSARVDVEEYGHSCRVLQNFTIKPHGGAYRRAGTHLIAESLGKTRLIPFQYNVEQTYVLVLTHEKMRFLVEGALLLDGGSPHEIDTPWAEDDLDTINFAQSADVMYLCHKDYRPRKLIRSTGTPITWTLETPDFETAMGSAATASGTFVTVTPATVPVTLEYAVVAADDDGTLGEGLPKEFTVANGQQPEAWLATDHANLTWAAVTEADYYIIYKKIGGTYGYIGIAPGATTFRDTNLIPDIGETPPAPHNPFYDSGITPETDQNNPATVAFHEQRLFFGGGKQFPMTIWGSQTGQFENFNRSIPLKASDSLEGLLYSRTVNSVKWLLSFTGGLMIGTAGGEFLMDSGGAPLTPLTMRQTPQSEWGSENMVPVVVGNNILVLQRQGSKPRDISFSLESDSFLAKDLSVRANQLFDGHTVRSWAYQETPNSILWCVREDGVLLGLTYLREFNIWAWHEHLTYDGVDTFESVASIAGTTEDQVYFAVKRDSTYYLEYFSPTWRESDGVEWAAFLDSAISTIDLSTTDSKTFEGMNHVIGRNIAVLGDGTPYKDIPVTAKEGDPTVGVFTLPRAHTLVHAGLSFTSLLAPLGVELSGRGGHSVGKMRVIPSLTIKVESSIGGEMGPDEDHLVEVKTRPLIYGDPIKPFTGDIHQNIPGKHSTDGAVLVKTDGPLPFSVLSLVPSIHIGE